MVWKSLNYFTSSDKYIILWQVLTVLEEIGTAFAQHVKQQNCAAEW